MNELTTQNIQLPDTLDDLAKFALIGREKLNAVRAEIRAIEKVGLAKEVHEQKLAEAQEIAEAVLDAEQRIGELLKDIEKQSGGDRKSANFKSNDAVTFEKPETKIDKLRQSGFSGSDDSIKNQVSQFQRLADNPAAVDRAKEEARARGEVVTRSDAINRIKNGKKLDEIESKGSDTLKEQVRSGDKSINQAWLEIKEKERKQEDMSAKAHLEKAAERHEEFKNAETVTMEDVKQDKHDQKELAKGKSRELRNAVKSILFIGAAVYGKDTDYSILRKNLSLEEIRVLRIDLGKAVNILITLLRIIGGENN